MREGCQRVLQEERVRRGCLFFFEGDVEVDGGAPFHGDLYRGALQIDECRVAVCLGCDAAVGDDVPDVEVGIAEDVYGCLEPSAFDDGDVDEGVAVAAAEDDVNDGAFGEERAGFHFFAVGFELEHEVLVFGGDVFDVPDAESA